MNNEEEFLNVLKDCWVGREYRLKSTAYSSRIKVLSDDGIQIIYKEAMESSSRVDFKRTVDPIFSDSKGYFKGYLEEYGFIRIK